MNQISAIKLAIERPAFIGNTLRLTAEFYNPNNGEPAEVENVFLRVYDGKREAIAVYPVKPYSPGKYRRDYTIPGEPLGPLTFEYAGEINGMPILARKEIDRIWAIDLPET